jgi:hypothetical protein
MSDEDNIVEFRSNADITPVKNKKYCIHQRVYIVKDDRQLRCQSCDAIVDLFDYLWDMANKRVRFKDNLASLRNKCHEVEYVLKDLERQERNARARLKRLNAKLK